MALLDVPDVQYRGFENKILFFEIDVENTFLQTRNTFDYERLLAGKITLDELDSMVARRSFEYVSCFVIKVSLDYETWSTKGYFDKLGKILKANKIRYVTKVLVFSFRTVFIIRGLEEPFASVDNLILVSILRRITTIEECIKSTNFNSVQQQLTSSSVIYYESSDVPMRLDPKRHNIKIWDSTTTLGLYMNAINPAVAIIINHFTFPEEKQFRIGSDLDVKNLSELFALKKIPQIIIQDAKMEHNDAVFDLLKNLDPKGINTLYIIIMSHGKANDVISTIDGEYPLYDRISEVLENSALKNVTKIFFVVACRGVIDPRHESINPRKTDAKILDNKTVVIHSAPKDFVSLRLESSGSVFVQRLLEVWSEIFDEITINEFIKRLEIKLETCKHYRYYDKGFIEAVKKDETDEIILDLKLTNARDYRLNRRNQDKTLHALSSLASSSSSASS